MLIMFHSITNVSCWYFLRGIFVIIIESVSMNSCMFILVTHFPKKKKLGTIGSLRVRGSLTSARVMLFCKEKKADVGRNSENAALPSLTYSYF